MLMSGLNQSEIIKMARDAGIVVTGEAIYTLCKLVAQHEREACAYRAGIALLGADRGLANRVDQAIRAKDAT
jgi:hypothetical protein